MRTLRIIFWIILGALILPVFMQAQPSISISNFTPASGPVGTLVTITGTNLSSPTALSIGGVPAITISNTGTSLVAMVMPGANTGTISITTAGGTANGAGNFTITPAQTPNGQQGGKLSGTGATGAGRQGWAVDVSADGNTAIVGGYADNSNAGAAWIYTRSGSTWTQQGNKLVGTGATGAAQQGYSVSISADGNMAIVGGHADNSNAGAAWVFVRSGSTWTQQGNKLVGTGATGTTSRQGWSVSLSADGNTAIVGGYGDNSLIGAAWVYTRTGTSWAQQGNKLVGTGGLGAPRQGWSVAISADGNTAIVGGYQDNSSSGAAWVFARSGSTWAQQGSKLVGTGNTGAALQGYSVSLSADGNTAIVGGIADNSLAGAAWVYTRSGTTWAQQGNKLVGTGAAGASQQGGSVTLSADGNTALVGAIADNSNTGATWAFTRSGTNWTQQSNKMVGTGASGAAQQGCSVAISADGNTAIAGGFSDNSNAGAIWVYTYVPPPAPNITNFTPGSGPVGTLVTITGTNLSNPTALIIGGVSAIPISNIGTSLVAMVMPGATTGTLTVSTAAGTVNAAGNFNLTSSQPPNTQQGAKFVGTGATGASRQGCAVAVSADGNTAIVGGSADNSNAGAAWVYTRSGTNWTQQGNKLVGAGAIGNAQQGYSVSISADGNTAIVGGIADNSNIGAAWVFTRSGTTWSQEGNQLVGTGAIGAGKQGSSVSLSADGNMAIVGGPDDNSSAGAAWVFTRSGTTWTQQGNKLVGTAATGAARQGWSVSMSADGNTAMVGGFTDNSSTGAVWVFTRIGDSWTQQGNKLVGTGATGAARQGISVALSANGNTAMVGGYEDNTNEGAAWVFTRSGSTWTQQGNKLVGTGATGTTPRQGWSVSLSADGNTAIVGGYGDKFGAGASWVYTRNAGSWLQQGAKLLGTGATSYANQGSAVAMSADGNTALVGGPGDNTFVGAAWAYVYNTPPPPPTITNFTPGSGPVGGLVTITGTNLSNPTALIIGGVPAITISNTGAILVAMVMPGATNGPVSITTMDGTANGAGNFTLTLTQAPNTQQGGKLVGTGAIGTSQQAYSVALSADGNTAIVGGYADNTNAGAVWIYTRSGTSWTQQGSKLVINPFSENKEGFSVAISADGNTAIVGAPGLNFNFGGALVYTRSGSTWTQQGGVLVGTGAIGKSNQGNAVSISADGNTVIVGGPDDNSFVGAAWIFTRSGSIWTQQGNKLLGTGVTGAANQGLSVSVSADGNTAMVGGPGDNGAKGAAWVYARSGSTWTQQGNKLIGTGATGTARQAYSVSLSADGNTAIIGGDGDNSFAGAAWVFTRNGNTWAQQGNKLVGSGSVGAARQGTAISISADGNKAIVGGYSDDIGSGASWVFARSGENWAQQGAKLVGTGAIGFAYQGTSVALSADGTTAMMGGFRDNGDIGAAWVFNYIPALPPTITNFTPVSGPVGTLVTITGTNLSNPTALIIGGVPAVPISNTGNSLIAMVMPGATTSAVSITTAGGTTNGAVNFALSPALPPNTQQGNKLAGTGAIGAAQQGFSVAISADGNTAIVGAFADNFFAGAAWVYTRSGTSWSQQGTKLVGTGAIGNAYQGYSVAISADGNTAIIGGSGDNSGIGAAWIFTRLGNVWTQQGNKLLGTGVQGDANLGSSVAISADGNNVIVGGPNNRAAWVFRRSGANWSQRGGILYGDNLSNFGWSVAISADGNTAISGEPSDNSNAGAAWVFAYNDGLWKVQGNKLVGTGATGAAQQGYSVALSADGNTALVGGRSDNSGAGATWAYTRSGTTWTQQGDKLVGTGAIGIAQQGVAVALSADGNMAMVGGDQDNSSAGAIWMFTRSGSSWTQQGNKLVGTGQVGNAEQGRSVALSADGKTALVGGSKDNGYTGTTWVFTNALQLLYTFTGSGNWDVAANWANNQIPPAILPANAQIVIDPAGSGECILNVPVTIPASATLTVAEGKKLRIVGNLNISQ